jgi:hypothetical protein
MNGKKHSNKAFSSSDDEDQPEESKGGEIIS